MLRHFLRLSQETLGQDVDIHLGLGTCTMKYSPKVNEALVRSHKVTRPAPAARTTTTVQGILEVMHRFERILCEISGHGPLHRSSPAAAPQAIYANARMIRAVPRGARRGAQRDEIITTVFSHPCDGAGPATAGFKLITLYPGADGYPDARRSARPRSSERTAGLMITNPEDTGIFNPHIDRFVELVHEAGGLCHYDQANANGILGITRARDAGFDLCQFNLHKTFGVAARLDGHARRRRRRVTAELAPLLPGRRSSSTATATTWTTTGRSRSARCARSTACRRRSSAPTPGCSASAPRACARSPRPPC